MTITINEILRSKESQNIQNVKKIAMYIKGKLLAITKIYPSKQIARYICKLHLRQFMASHEIAKEKTGWEKGGEQVQLIRYIY